MTVAQPADLPAADLLTADPLRVDLLTADPLMRGVLSAAADDRSYAGPIGLVVVILLGIVTVLLVRNMDRRIKRLPGAFAPEQPRPPADHRPDPPTAPGGPGRA